MNSDIERRIACLYKQLDDLKASLAKKDDGLWVPQCGESYWFVDNDAEAIERTYVDSNVSYERVLFGNFFKTQEQASRHAKRLKLFNKLWKLAEHLNGDWVPDCSDRWVIVIDIYGFRPAPMERYGFCVPIFRSEELAQRAIEMLTDEEKEIFKNIYKPQRAKG